MKKQLLLLVCLLSFSISQSQTFNDGVLEYTVISGTDVSVKKYGSCPTGALTIPSTVIDNGTTYTVIFLGNNAFMDCSSLTSVNIPNSVISINKNAFLNCITLTNLIIPNSVTYIGSYAFQSCSDLISINIPNSVTTIGIASFRFCSNLTSVIIPNSVTSLADGVFSSCSSLTSVTVNWATPLVVPTNIFQGVNISTIPLTVPSGTVALYQAATVWQDFGSIVLSTEDFTENTIDAQLFPNPFSNQFTITTETEATYTLFTISGKRLKKGKLLIGDNPIEVSMLSKGIYFIQIENEYGVLSKKIIKE